MSAKDEKKNDKTTNPLMQDYSLNLLVPFTLEKSSPNYYELSSDSFKISDFSSLKLTKEADEIILRKGNTDNEIKVLCLYNYFNKSSESVVEKNYKFIENEIEYVFSIKHIKMFAFEKRINFLLINIELLSANGISPSIDALTDFSSLICRVRDGIKRFNSESFRDILQKLIGSYHPVYIGNNLPTLIEEKPKVLGYAQIEDFHAGTSSKLCNLTNNQPSGFFSEDINCLDSKYSCIKDGESMAISNNGMFFLKKANKPMLYWDEYLFSYILSLYNYYVILYFTEKISLRNFDFSTNNAQENLKKIIGIRKEYILYGMSTVTEYTRMDSVNLVIEIIKSYFNKGNNIQKFETKLKELNEIAEVLEKKVEIEVSKAKELKSKKIEIAVVLVTSILMLFSITEGIFRLFERLSSIGNNVYNIIKIILAFSIWFVILFVTVKKIKK